MDYKNENNLRPLPKLLPKSSSSPNLMENINITNKKLFHEETDNFLDDYYRIYNKYNNIYLFGDKNKEGKNPNPESSTYLKYKEMMKNNALKYQLNVNSDSRNNLLSLEKFLFSPKGNQSTKNIITTNSNSNPIHSLQNPNNNSNTNNNNSNTEVQNDKNMNTNMNVSETPLITGPISNFPTIINNKDNIRNSTLGMTQVDDFDDKIKIFRKKRIPKNLTKGLDSIENEYISPIEKIKRRKSFAKKVIVKRYVPNVINQNSFSQQKEEERGCVFKPIYINGRKEFYRTHLWKEPNDSKDNIEISSEGIVNLGDLAALLKQKLNYISNDSFEFKTQLPSKIEPIEEKTYSPPLSTQNRPNKNRKILELIDEIRQKELINLSQAVKGPETIKKFKQGVLNKDTIKNLYEILSKLKAKGL